MVVEDEGRRVVSSRALSYFLWERHIALDRKLWKSWIKVEEY